MTRAQCTIDDLKLVLASDDIMKVLGKLENIFMVFILHSIRKEYNSVKDQALRNIIIPTLEEMIDHLVRGSLPVILLPSPLLLFLTLVVEEVSMVKDVVEGV